MSKKHKITVIDNDRDDALTNFESWSERTRKKVNPTEEQWKNIMYNNHANIEITKLRDKLKACNTENEIVDKFYLAEEELLTELCFKEIKDFNNEQDQISGTHKVKDPKVLKLTIIIVILTSLLVIQNSYTFYYDYIKKSNDEKIVPKADTKKSNDEKIVPKADILQQITSFAKFRVRFDSGKRNVISDSVQIWNKESWHKSSFLNILDTISSKISAPHQNNNLNITITGHADDYAKNESKKDKLNRDLANIRRINVDKMLRSKIEKMSLSNICFYNGSEIPWWDVDDEDARDSPGDNPDFRVVLIVIKQTYTISKDAH